MAKKKKQKKKKNNIKIVIGLPVWSHLCESTESSLYSLHGHPYVIGRMKVSGSLVYEARNEIVAQALDKFPDMTHLLFVDSDMTFGIDHMLALVEAGKDIIGGVACNRQYPWRPCYLNKEDDDKYPELINELKKPFDEQKPYKVKSVGMGFTLISRKALEKNSNVDGVPSLWFYPQDGKGEDYSFCELAKKNGFDIWIHPSCQLGHLTDYIVTIRDCIYGQEEKQREGSGNGG